MIIKTQYKFHETKRSKGNKFSTTDDFLMKFCMHNHTIVVSTQYKFYEIPSIAY